MKRVQLDETEVVMMRERGLGDGGEVVRYFVVEADGTYSQVGEWWADPAAAKQVYDDPDGAHLQWIINEARRQTVPKEQRVAQARRPAPVAIASRGR